MENKGDAGKGAFEWKIDSFLEWKENVKTSSPFKLGTCYCFLDIGVIDNDDVGKGYIVYINEYISQSINFKTSFKLCLIDGRGDEVLVAKRTIFKFNSLSFPLMTIWNCDLHCEENNFLPGGVLTLRLSWCNAKCSVCEQDTQTAPCLNSEKAPSKLLQRLSEDFGRYYESKVDTDFLLRVGEVLIPVHRSVLSARSEVFAAMFRHETLGKRSGVVDIPDVDASVLSDVLYYVYSGQIRVMSANTICPMYVVADKYALIELRDASMDVLMCNLTVENVCDAVQLAHTYGEIQLEEKVVQFVKAKFKDIEKTSKWKELLKSQPILGLKLLSTALKICKDEVNDVSPK